MVWMFIDDNDDEFKDYQIKYNQILKEKTELEYNALYTEVSDLKKELEADLEQKKKELKSKKEHVTLISDALKTAENKYARIDLDFKAIVASADNDWVFYPVSRYVNSPRNDSSRCSEHLQEFERP